MSYRSKPLPLKRNDIIFPPNSQEGVNLLSPAITQVCSSERAELASAEDHQFQRPQVKYGRNRSTAHLNIKFFHCIPYTESKITSQVTKREKEEKGAEDGADVKTEFELYQQPDQPIRNGKL